MRNILFCGNSKVFGGFLSAMLSILMRTETKEPFQFFILTMDLSHLNPDYKPLSENEVSFLDKTARSFNAENSVKKIDVTTMYMEEFASCPNEACYCSPYTLIRLFADKIPELGEKFLYLDADILFNKDITLLYDIDVSGFEYAAARDHYGKIILFFLRRFINAGVILFNMDECRRTSLFEKSRRLIKTKKLVFADESALVRSTTRQKIISQRFNDQKFMYKDTVVRHFSRRLFYFPYPHIANIKQWQVEDMRSAFGYTQFDDILRAYEELVKKTF